MRLLDLLDPDRDWRSWDKVQHLAACFALCALFDLLGFAAATAFVLTVWTAAVYEAGQADATYSIRDGSGRRYAGRPGYGFGLLDLGVGILGALCWLGLRALVGF